MFSALRILNRARIRQSNSPKKTKIRQLVLEKLDERYCFSVDVAVLGPSPDLFIGPISEHHSDSQHRSSTSDSSNQYDCGALTMNLNNVDRLMLGNYCGSLQFALALSDSSNAPGFYYQISVEYNQVAVEGQTISGTGSDEIQGSSENQDTYVQAPSNPEFVVLQAPPKTQPDSNQSEAQEVAPPEPTVLSPRGIALQPTLAVTKAEIVAPDVVKSKILATKSDSRASWFVSHNSTKTDSLSSTEAVPANLQAARLQRAHMTIAKVRSAEDVVRVADAVTVVEAKPVVEPQASLELTKRFIPSLAERKVNSGSNRVAALLKPESQPNFKRPPRVVAS